MTFNLSAIFQNLRAHLCRWLGMSYHYWGNARDDKTSHEQAVRWYQCALDLNPNLVQTRLDQGVLYWRELDRPQDAIRQFSYLLARETKPDAALFNRALAYQQLRDYSHALDDFRAYLNIGTHPHWRKYAEKMVAEFNGMPPRASSGPCFAASREE